MAEERPNKKKLSEKSIEASLAVLNKLGEQLLDGDISISEFESRFKGEMKAEYIRQYVLGIGGLENMTQADWATVAADLEAQYKYADNYIDELDAAADLDDDGVGIAALLWRIALYAGSAGAVYEAANKLFFKNEGYDLEVWNLDDRIDPSLHCDHCVGYAEQGPQPIGTFPEPGDGTTPCLDHCHCWKTYERSGGADE